MGYDLSRTIEADPNDPEGWTFGGESYHANMAGWRWLVERGQDHGWEPAGTMPPEIPGRSFEGWDPKNYGTNDQQRVTDADAMAWADALESGKPYTGESPRWREMVDEFIAYCRGGGFLIG